MYARGRIVAIEAGIGVMVAGAVLRNPIGWTLLGLGVAVLVLALLKVDKRVIAWLGREEPASAPQVINSANRNGPAVGVVGDGQGFAASLEIDTGAPVRLQLADLASFVADDPSELAGAQVLIEQFRGLSRRVWIVLRHEPMWAQTAVEERGGGAEGARAALAAAIARLQVRLSDQNLPAAPLSSVELSTMFASVGDLKSSGASYCCLTANVSDWQRILQATAASSADISYVSVRVDGPPSEVAIRLVAADHRRVATARQEVLASGVAMDAEQREGLVATLPFGGGARSLVGAIGLVRR
ncbi:type VII secretion protein EccE [Kibdelosporangium aridum]|uniref:type VII secretion protein EccE n=1 Tax=Kibdelosporangium aridum TaxID=2030 RepID=UPI000B31088A